MTTKKTGIVTLLTIAALTAAAVVTVFAMVRAAASSIDGGTVFFMAWAISPYVCFFLAARLIKQFLRVPHTARLACLISFLMLTLTVNAYVWSPTDTSSTDSLIFIFIPLYLYVGSLLMLTIGVGVAWLVHGRRT